MSKLTRDEVEGYLIEGDYRRCPRCELDLAPGDIYDHVASLSGLELPTSEARRELFLRVLQAYVRGHLMEV